MSDWNYRTPDAGDCPVAPNTRVQYGLAGENCTYFADAGELNWGPGVGPNGEGRIGSYRVICDEPAPRKHAHYFKPVQGLEAIDVYRTLELFGVTDQALGHAVKKLLVAGGRGAGKDIRQDVQEAIDTLQRWQEMRAEDSAAKRSAA